MRRGRARNGHRLSVLPSFSVKNYYFGFNKTDYLTANHKELLRRLSWRKDAKALQLTSSKPLQLWKQKIRVRTENFSYSLPLTIIIHRIESWLLWQTMETTSVALNPKSGSTSRFSLRERRMFVQAQRMLGSLSHFQSDLISSHVEFSAFVGACRLDPLSDEERYHISLPHARRALWTLRAF